MAHHLLILRVIFGIRELGGRRRQLRMGCQSGFASRVWCRHCVECVEQSVWAIECLQFLGFLTLSCLEPTSASAMVLLARRICSARTGATTA